MVSSRSANSSRLGFAQAALDYENLGMTFLAKSFIERFASA
jgi:hypothetical protein